MERERPHSNTSHKSDTLRQKRNSFHQNASNGDNKLDQFDPKQIRLPEIKRESSVHNQIQVYPKTSSASATKALNSHNQSQSFYDNNQLNGAAIYASYNTAGVGQIRGSNVIQKSRQSLEMAQQPYFRQNLDQQMNIADINLASDIQNQQPVAIGLSYVLNKIKKDRKQTDDEALIMENRIKLLKKEEMKTKKKIEEMNQKSEDIFQIKARHEKTKQMREQIQLEEKMRQDIAQEQHESMRIKQKEKRFEKISEILLKNRMNHEQIKQEKQTIKIMLLEQRKLEENENQIQVRKLKKKQNQISKKLQEQKFQGVEKIIERYQEEIQFEEQRKLENQLRIQKMEQIEQNLIKKLQKSQIIQHQALLQLQDAIKLKPNEYVAKITSKSMEMGQGKQRLIIKRGQNTESDPYSQESTQPLNYQLKKQGIQDDQSKSFTANYASSLTPNKQQQQNEKLNQTYCLDSNVKESELTNNIHNSNQNQSFNFAQEFNISPSHQSKELTKSDKQAQQNVLSGSNNKPQVSQFETDENKNSQEINKKADNEERQSALNNKREFLSRSANDIILQNNTTEINLSNQQTLQNKKPVIGSNNKVISQESKTRSRSTFKYELRQNVSPNQIRGLSQSNYQNFDTENYIQRFDTDNQVKELNKKRKKSKKKKTRKSQSISVSQQQLLNYSSNYSQQQMYAYPTPNLNLNPAFNLAYPPSSNKKSSSITPIKQNIILTKPPMVF